MICILLFQIYIHSIFNCALMDNGVFRISPAIFHYSSCIDQSTVTRVYIAHLDRGKEKKQPRPLELDFTGVVND